MIEILKDAAIALILAGVCAIGAWLLKTRKQQILAITADLIQKAEQAVSGSGLGQEKKALVISQLEAMGIRVTDLLAKEIDNIVAWLNEKGAWYMVKAKDTADNASAASE
ncbi:MAG: hypothetical protein EOM54_05525 [Clostridia bacterium]|nr:hypothetical protein [Clostridia bacterium]